MAYIITETQTLPMTRKQFKGLLREVTAIKSAMSLGAAMEYTLTMLDGRQTVVIVKAETEHDLVSARIGELR